MSNSQNFNALREGNSWEFHAQKSPKCPHCGQQFDIQAREAWELYSEGDHEVVCLTCSLPFTVSSVATFTFSTDDQADLDG